MQSEKIISIQDIIQFKPISINVNEAKALDPFILEAQEFDIRPILGDPLYLAILDDLPVLSTFGDLVNGVAYTYDGDNYEHKGIKACLIYYSYSRYLANANSHSTPSGMVSKRNDYSDPLDEKTMTRLIQQAKAGAVHFQEQFVKYLNRFETTYPLWKTTCEKQRKGSIRIRSISKT